jgi:hypothetical protein
MVTNSACTDPPNGIQVDPPSASSAPIVATTTADDQQTPSQHTASSVQPQTSPPAPLAITAPVPIAPVSIAPVPVNPVTIAPQAQNGTSIWNVAKRVFHGWIGTRETEDLKENLKSFKMNGITEKGSRWVRERQTEHGGQVVERTVRRSVRVKDGIEKREREKRLLKAA